jgi:predicted ATPase
MPSVLWAGERTKGPVRLVLQVKFDQLAFQIQCGLPIVHPTSAFQLDPQVKEERIWSYERNKKIILLERDHTTVRARAADGSRVLFPMALSASESVLAELREPAQFTELSALREEFLAWRFYHHFRTDSDSPLRQPQVGVRTPVLSHDGHDLAAALQTIVEIGDRPALEEAIALAFPGASLLIDSPRGRFSVSLKMPEFQRPFEVQELSDGTLHYLCLVAAFLSPRPPPLLAINEPETSIHPTLLEPLAKLIVRASRDSQIWITTHSEALAGYVDRECGVAPVQLEKVNGETRVVA